MISVVLCGADGAMGQVLQRAIEDHPEFEYMGYLSPRKGVLGKEYAPQLVIDFSRPENLDFLLNYALEKNCPLMLCTTGYSEQDVEKIKEAGKSIPLVLSANTSVGIEAMRRIIELITPMLEGFEIGIIDKHHSLKKDAPGGTAKKLVAEVQKARGGEVQVQALRLGTIPGEHIVCYAGQDEVIEIKHSAYSKRIFAQGALHLGQRLIKQSPGMYETKDLF